MINDFFSFIKKTYETSPIKDCPMQDMDAFNAISEKVININLAEKAEDATILIVDDNTDLLEYVGESMGDFVKKVYTASDAYKAIECLTMHDIDVIISDIMMPGMNGFELCHYVKNNVIVSHIPVILLTARVDAESKNLGYKNGADDYITKPFLEEEIVKSINKLLRQRQESKEKITRTLTIDTSSTFSPVDEKLLNNFHKVVTENIEDPDFGVQKVTDLLKMNHTILFNKIVQLTGLNIISYINRVRLEQAINLMKTTEMSMAEIAEHTGFSNQRYFSTAFKNYTGTSPLKYKNSINETNV